MFTFHMEKYSKSVQQWSKNTEWSFNTVQSARGQTQREKHRGILHNRCVTSILKQNGVTEAHGKSFYSCY